MKPKGEPGSSVTAIGVGLFVAFGGVLFGYVTSYPSQSNYETNGTQL